MGAWFAHQGTIVHLSGRISSSTQSLLRPVASEASAFPRYFPHRVEIGKKQHIEEVQCRHEFPGVRSF
jgi:hypothetical protein